MFSLQGDHAREFAFELKRQIRSVAKLRSQECLLSLVLKLPDSLSRQFKIPRDALQSLAGASPSHDGS